MKKLLCTLIAAVIVGISCSVSTNDDQLSWYAKYTMPIVNRSFFIADILKNIVLDSNFFITDPDTGNENPGDTFCLHIRKSDLKTYESDLFNSNDLNFTYKFSSFKIKGLPIISDTISIPVIDNINELGKISIKKQLKTDLFKSIKIDSFSNLIKIKIENLTDSVLLNEIIFKLSGLDSTIIWDINGSSYIDSIVVSNLIIDSIIEYEIIADLDVLKDHLDSLKLILSYDLNNIGLDFGKLLDHYIDFSFEQLFYIPITMDGFNLSYIDLIEVDLPITIKNPFPVSFNGALVMNSMSDLKDVKENYWKNYGKNGALGNSLNFNIIGNKNGNSYTESKVDAQFRNKRLYAEWDSVFQICYVPITVSGKLVASGSDITLSKDMEIGISVNKPKTEINELKGLYKKPVVVVGKPDDFDMPLTNLENILSIIRDKVKLTDNELSVELEFLMPDSSRLSKVKYWCVMIMFAGNEKIIDTLSWTMEDIKGGDISKYLFEVNKMVNVFPDSIKYRIDYEFPSGSEIHLTDSLFKNEGGKSSVVMNVNFNLELISSLVWEINEDVSIDLGVIDIPISQIGDKGGLLLKEKVFYTEFNLHNQTNFSGRVYGLGSLIDKKDLLQKITVDSFISNFHYLSTDTLFTSIMGNDGLELPSRGEMKIDTVLLDNNTMNEVLTLDSLSLRLALKIFPTILDALVDTDFVSVNASATIEGIQSSDDFD